MRQLRCLLITLAVSFAAMAGNVQAQEPAQSRSLAISDFAQDLEKLQNSIPNAQAIEAMSQAGNMGKWWDEVIHKAQEMKDRWSNNPYIRVTGFSVGIAFPPSIDVDFEFK